MVDSPDVVHLKQLTGRNTSSRRLDRMMAKNKQSSAISNSKGSTYSRRDLRLTKCFPWPWGGRKCLHKISDISHLWLERRKNTSGVS